MIWAGNKKKLFGDYLQLMILAKNKKEAQKTLKKTHKEALRLQKIFNFYDNKSELNKLNKKRKHNASKELLEVLTKALSFCKESKGTYDITKGKNFIRRKQGRKTKDLSCNYKDITINKNVINLKHKDILIDLSSIAKGYIADKLGTYLKKQGIKDYVIDARGDVLLEGKATPTIRIQHPREQNSHITTLHVKDAGIATSGDYEQYKQNYDNSHLLGNKEYSSITVIAPTLIQADAYATMISVTNKQTMKELLAKNKKIAVMTIDKKLNKTYYNNFRLLASNI